MRAAGYLYEAGTSKRVAATLERIGDGYRLESEAGSEARNVEIASVADPLGSIPQKITFATGEAFAPHAPLPEGFLGDHAKRAVHRFAAFERFSWPKAAFLVGLLVVAVIALRAAVPLIADGVASLIPRSAEAVIGERSFAELGGTFFSDSEIPPERQSALREKFGALARAGRVENVPVLHFRKSKFLGANAFALPGGPIVVTDDLVRIMPDDAAILGVLAHELGHVEESHGLRQVLRVSGLFLMASLILGADETMLEELAAVAVSLTTSSYSRDFENDADAYARGLLEAAGRSAEDLARGLEALAKQCGAACDEAGWFSTHPGMDARIDALRK